jgi:hypothetical protein
MNINDEVIFSIFMALEGLHAYSAFLPSIMTIGTFVDTPEKVRMIHQGEIVATVFLGALAGSVALMVRSYWPLVMAAVAGGVMLAVYEYALRHAPAHDHDEEPDYFASREATA